MSNPTLKYAFNNNYGKDIIVIIEPWAEEFTVQAGSVLSMDISYRQIGLLETAIDQVYFTIWLWSGCAVTTVSIDGKDHTLRSLAISVP
jgi:hypothetical protein